MDGREDLFYVLLLFGLDIRNNDHVPTAQVVGELAKQRDECDTKIFILVGLLPKVRTLIMILYSTSSSY